MVGLLEQLRRFNAKERYWLIHNATGNPPLSQSFCSDLSEVVDQNVPGDAWWAMDYHLDWIEAALLCTGVLLEGPFPEPESGRNFNRNQEDVDLIVAWDTGDNTNIVVIEAKGATSWGNEQYASKLKRLTYMHKQGNEGPAGVTLQFVLASPSRPKRLVAKKDATWACANDGSPRWIELQMPDNLQRLELATTPAAAAQREPTGACGEAGSVLTI